MENEKKKARPAELVLAEILANQAFGGDRERLRMLIDDLAAEAPNLAQKIRLSLAEREREDQAIRYFAGMGYQVDRRDLRFYSTAEQVALTEFTGIAVFMDGLLVFWEPPTPLTDDCYEGRYGRGCS